MLFSCPKAPSQSALQKNEDILNVYIVYVCESSAHRDQKKASDSLEWKLQAVLSLLRAGN